MYLVPEVVILLHVHAIAALQFMSYFPVKYSLLDVNKSRLSHAKTGLGSLTLSYQKTI